MFDSYIGQKTNKAGVKVERTPWCDGNMSKETGLIAEKLSKVGHPNLRNIVLTISITGEQAWSADHKLPAQR